MSSPVLEGPNHLDMEKKQKEAIRLNWMYITENLLVKEVLDYMIEWEIFSVDLKDEVLSHPSKTDHAREFLFSLGRRGPQAFFSFVKALEHTGQHFIAQRILEAVS